MSTLLGIALLSGLLPGAPGGTGDIPAPLQAPAAARATRPFGALPLIFQPTTDAPAGFWTHPRGATVRFSPTELLLLPDETSGQRAEDREQKDDPDSDLDPSFNSKFKTAAPAPRAGIRLQFLGAHPNAMLSGSTPLPGRVNYLRGPDPAGWRTDLPTYGTIRYTGLYPGVDLEYTGHDGSLKGTYILAPGADPARIRWRYAGAQTVHLDEAGDLQIILDERAAGSEQGAEDGATHSQRKPQTAKFVEAVPVAWQDGPDGRTPVAVRFQVGADGTVGFAPGAYDLTRPLVIDPILTYSTYLGGSDNDVGRAIAVDGTGNIYVTGYTKSPDFPLTTHRATVVCNDLGYNAYVSKLSADGLTLIYSTYFGGDCSDYGWRIAVDGAGNAYVSGITRSPNFPTVRPIQATFGGGYSDAFVAELNPTGTGFVYATYLGGAAEDRGQGIALALGGAAVVTGWTASPNFPVAHPLQAASAGGADAFVARLTATGAALDYATYLGGAGNDYGTAVALDGAGAAYVTGRTASANFPALGGVQPALAGGDDTFVAKLTAAGSALDYATYLGGPGDERGQGIAVDADGAAYVTGSTAGGFPTTAGALRPTFGGGTFDAFVTKLDPAGSSLAYSTYLGGNGDDNVTNFNDAGDIAVDAGRDAYVTGFTLSTDFPAVNANQPTNVGGADAFVTELAPDGATALYATYLGGSSFDYGRSIALGAPGSVYIGGNTYSTNYPVAAHPYQSISGGSYDTFLTRIDGTIATPPPPAPAPIDAGLDEQQAPRTDGALVIWEDHTGGIWHIQAKDLATGRVFPVYAGPGTPRHPAVSGNLVVWQQTGAGGNRDIYAARIAGDAASAPFAVATDLGDQVNPAVSHEVVVWQSTTQTGAASARWDIVARDLRAGSAVVLTTPDSTNINPAVDVRPDGNTAVWQTNVPTATLALKGLAAPGRHGRWTILGAGNITNTHRTTILFDKTFNDQTYPGVSGSNVVWQETAGAEAAPQPKGRWSINRRNLGTGATTTLAGGLDHEPHPTISGNRVVWQEFVVADGRSPFLADRWIITSHDLTTDTDTTVATDVPGTAEPRPDVSGGHVVWQQITAALGSDVYGNVGFSDVQPADYFYAPVQALGTEGVISGYADGTFRPYNPTTRAQLAKMIVLSEGWLIDTTGGPHFSDVPTTHPFYPYIETAVHHGVIVGYADGSFRPYANVTRGQLCKIIVRAYRWPLDTSGGPHFSDLPPADPFYAVIETAYHHGIITGFADGTFRPGAATMRGQATKILYLAHNPVRSRQ